MVNKCKITKDFLYEEWVINRKSQKEIAKENNVGLWHIEKCIKDFKLTGIRDKIKYLYKENLFNINIPEFAYLIGLIISDGYVDLKNNRVSISLTNTPEPLYAISSFFSKECITPVYQYNARNNNLVYRLTLSNKYLIEILKDLKIGVKDKTENVRFPDFLNYNCFKMALRGFIDGDGNIRNTGHSLTFRAYIHSEYLIKDLIKLFKKWFNYELTVIKVKHKVGKEISTKTDFTFKLIELYEGYEDFCITHKKNIIKTLVDDIVRRYEMINHNNWRMLHKYHVRVN